MSDCLFCKIIAGEIPCYKVYEDENVLAFLDIHPHAKGHTVVIPKKHAETVWDINTETFERVAAGLQTAAGKVQAQLKPDGMNIGLNNGKAAGQAVGHLHWHILPRWEGDGGGSMHSIIRNDQGADVKEIAKLFF
jgi:histidine triad (HIT) family protein